MNPFGGVYVKGFDGRVYFKYLTASTAFVEMPGL
jgi:hypothetical protein